MATMTMTPTDVTVAAGRRSRRMSPRSAFALQVSILVSLLTASSAPTPLYSVYRSEWGFSPITITVVFGIYAIAVLAALLVVGKLSDYVGRRPVVIGALVIQLAALAVFLTASTVTDLVIARIVQGVSTGAAAGALGAALLDIDQQRGTIANAVFPVSGTAAGALLSGIFVQYLPAATHLVYLVILGVFVVQLVAVLFMPETSSPKPGALASLKPEIAVPSAVRRPMMVAVPALIAVWALAGFYGSLGPTLVRLLSGSASFVLGGLSLTVLAGAASISTYFVRAMAPQRLMILGSMALLIGVAATLWSVEAGSTVGFFIATAVAGTGFGGGFQGGLRMVVPLAAPHERAGVISSVYVVSYLALGAPAVGAGFLVDHVGVLATARDYTLFIIGLATIALSAALVRAWSSRPAAGRSSVCGPLPGSLQQAG
jgi:MFS family permease